MMKNITTVHKVDELLLEGKLIGEGSYIIKIKIYKTDNRTLVEFITNSNDILPIALYLDDRTAKSLGEALS